MKRAQQVGNRSQRSGALGAAQPQAVWSEARTGAGSILGALTDGRPSALSLAAVYVAYLVAAAFGQWVMVIPDVSITVWPPNGVVVAALLLHPRKSWHWWIAVAFAGELTANLVWFHNPTLHAMGYMAANAAEVLFAGLILIPFLNPPLRQFATLRQVLAFLTLGVILAPVVGATLISAIDALIGKNAFTVVWPLLWLGDATGILIATPLVICAAELWRERARPSAARTVEAAAIGFLLVALTAWHLLSDLANGFLLFIPVLWAALRFQWVGSSHAVLTLALLIGYFAQDVPVAVATAERFAQRHSMLQVLVLVVASTGLVAAAMISELRAAVTGLAEANASLEDRVEERKRQIEAAEKRFRATFENAAVGIAMVSADGMLARVNAALAKMLAYERTEMEGQSLDHFTHQSDLSRGHDAMDRLRRGEAESYEVEKRYLSKSGDIVWARTSVSSVRNPDGTIAYMIKIIQDITDRKHSEEIRQLLMREVNHRSKNLLATIQAIARQTASKMPRDFMDNFSRRLQALAANQDLLVKSGWEDIDLKELVRSQLAHFGGLLDSRILLEGSPVLLSPAAAQAIGMAIHELGTNAAKYGALSNEAGRVEVGWSLDESIFRIAWREADGPAVTSPASTGFGTTVLDMLVKTTLSGEVHIDYAREGLSWTLQCPRTSLRQQMPPDAV
ncbi:MASE1 domain-containing protein [Frigidibacter sp. SD6-1]|uniref:MASE1 domain-containing protein n=1 Tax=Frigidibacter sp. SD6-1 TaxID=3032581 RepID=UPI0024DFA4D1|nr:MASE1 domain-containing protein [Frigidibacter sp. SD6-1]